MRPPFEIDDRELNVLNVNIVYDPIIKNTVNIECPKCRRMLTRKSLAQSRFTFFVTEKDFLKIRNHLKSCAVQKHKN
jgi:hypothetical protein